MAIGRRGWRGWRRRVASILAFAFLSGFGGQTPASFQTATAGEAADNNGAAADAADAADGVVLLNLLGRDLVGVYAILPGQPPLALAGRLSDDRPAMVPRDDLRGCSRIAVDVEGEGTWQFFVPGYFFGAERLVLEARSFRKNATGQFPSLLVDADGRGRYLPAGLPFAELAVRLAEGLGEAAFVEWLDPLPGSQRPAPGAFAVSLGETSWSLTAKDMDLEDDGRGGRRLAALRLASPLGGTGLVATLTALAATGARPWLLAVGSGRARAFDRAGLQIDPGAELAELPEAVTAEARMEVLMRALSSLPADALDADAEPVLRLVLATPSLRYDLRLRVDRAEATLEMARRP